MHDIIYKYMSELEIDKSICDRVIPLFKREEVRAGDIILRFGENTHVVCLFCRELYEAITWMRTEMMSRNVFQRRRSGAASIII